MTAEPPAPRKRLWRYVASGALVVAGLLSAHFVTLHLPRPGDEVLSVDLLARTSLEPETITIPLDHSGSAQMAVWIDYASPVEEGSFAELEGEIRCSQGAETGRRISLSGTGFGYSLEGVAIHTDVREVRTSERVGGWRRVWYGTFEPSAEPVVCRLDLHGHVSRIPLAHARAVVTRRQSVFHF
ncbi:MAG: hypothetical protein H6720_16060 [Sandaracinus sp.]|nr:hypothetical protein [Sandaracinus sp.]